MQDFVTKLLTRFQQKNSLGIDEISNKALTYCKEEIIQPLLYTNCQNYQKY